MKNAAPLHKSQSVYITILAPLMILLILEAGLMVSAINFSGMVRQLRQNAEEMFSQKVENRQSYLRSSMVSNWSDLSGTAEHINDLTEQMLQSGELDLSDITAHGGAALLEEAAPELIPMIHAKRISGAFVVLSAVDVRSIAFPRELSSQCLGLCVRDMDPAAPQPSRNVDLVLERAPVSVVQSLGIATTSNWQPMYDFQKDQCGSFLLPVYQALRSHSGLPAAAYGYWSEPYTLSGSQMTCIAYTVPLVLSDGTVYGAVGVEVQTSYLTQQLPAEELGGEGQTGYLLAVSQYGQPPRPILSVGECPEDVSGLDLSALTDWRTTFQSGSTVYVAAAEPLRLYGTNTPFSDQEWFLIGTVPKADLHSFSERISLLLSVIVLLILLGGTVGSFIISQMMARPIRRLAERVETARQNNEEVPDLPATGITEIDQFSDAIVSLSRSVTESSTRFLRIMDMASVELGGFELRRNEDAVFVTDNFFPMLGLENVPVSDLKSTAFYELLESLTPNLVPQSRPDITARLYQIGSRYIRVQITYDSDRIVGVAEDVTAATMERIRIERERDYDLLTGLYNRRAIYRMIDELFHTPEKIGCAALLMIDLDNLKGINDRFGHDLGDQYIRQAGRCFLSSVPDSTLCARLSGDEFYIFFYGYPDQDAIRAHIRTLFDTMNETTLLLPDGGELKLRASCGVAWYPQNAATPSVLMQYADFAMYQVKRGQKNGVAEFSRELYEQENNSALRRQEFSTLVEKALVSYHFQPIVNARTGAVYAYEALMRVDLPTLKNPEQVNETARQERRLGDIERLTWFEATRSFVSLRQAGKIEPSALLFLNSFANQHLSEADARLYHQEFANVQSQVVVEIVEADDLDLESTDFKRKMPGFSGMLALDDYGSGYNSEKNLLELAPTFVKIDMSIIRGIDSDADKQQLLSGIVAYAHQKEGMIIAEGVETAEELHTVIRLGVDLAQGYFLARPAAIPPGIAPEALRLIASLNQK